MPEVQVELSKEKNHLVVKTKEVLVEFIGSNVTVTVTNRESGTRFRCLGTLTEKGWVVNAWPALEVSK